MTTNRSDQVALLLKLLGDEATEAALGHLDQDTAQPIKSALDDYRTKPPTEAEIELVLEEFERHFRTALDQLGEEEAPSGESTGEKIDQEDEQPILQIAEENFDVAFEPAKKFAKPELTGDMAHDLNRMHPYQVAHAVRNDSPKTIAAVVRSLATEHAAKTLEFLPDAVRPNIFMQLAEPANIKPLVLERILSAALSEAMKVEERKPDEDSSSQMVMLMRSLPKNVRVPMLEELMKSNEELGNSVKSQLYQFEDVAKLDDRDMQKLLGQSSTDSLVLALQNADPALVERVMNNMSKRARDTLQEEMAFKTNAKDDEIEMGRAAIVATLVELDESGAISLD